MKWHKFAAAILIGGALAGIPLQAAAVMPAPDNYFIRGDATGDKSITTKDARVILQCAVGKAQTATAYGDQLCDVDKNGALDSADARMVLQYCVGKKVARVGEKVQWEYRDGGWHLYI